VVKIYSEPSKRHESLKLLLSIVHYLYSSKENFIFLHTALLFPQVSPKCNKSALSKIFITLLIINSMILKKTKYSALIWGLQWIC